MTTAIIIQARMGSTRLTGKVLQVLQDRTVLGHVISRCQAVSSADKVIVATTMLEQDRCIVREAEKYGAAWFCGSEHDVLRRYYEAATAIQADTVIRITSDCPLVDPVLIDKLIYYYQTGSFDYARIGLDSFSRGFDGEIFSYKVLQQAHEQAQSDLEREHVTSYILNRRELFRIGIYREESATPLYRLTLDTAEDWQLLSAIFAELYRGELIPRAEVEQFLQKNPQIASINEEVEQQHPTI